MTTGPEDAKLIGPVVHRPDAVDLFLFSAATWLPHRIHYDRDFARSEGLQDLPVQGPLQGAYLGELVGRWARQRGGRLLQLSYCHHAPAYSGEELTCEARRAGTAVHGADVVVALELTIRDATGALLTSGDAKARLPGTALGQATEPPCR